MSQFKLIAITPLLECGTDYCKNLLPGKSYQFYSDYSIVPSKDGREILSVINDKDSVPANLYELSNGIALSFSAVVGKNGTGKSTLFELFSYFIYVLSTHKDMGERRMLRTETEEIILHHTAALKDYKTLEKSIKEKTEGNTDTEIKSLSFLAQALNFKEKHNLYVLKSNISDEKSFAENVLKELRTKINRLEYDINEQKKWHSALIENLKVSIIYESDSQIRETAFYNNNFYFSVFTPKGKVPVSSSVNDFNFKDLFYSVSVNFSHHGLNANSIGTWINKLFHKNDAYTTPLVINPMRDEGNFNINHELNLSKERLHANLLYDLVNEQESSLLEKYTIKEFIFNPKSVSSLSLHPYSSDVVSGLQSIGALKDVLTPENLALGIPYWDFALAYLEKKISKVKKNYGFLIYDKNDGSSDEQQFDTFLLSDTSHVTKKLRQVINFLTTSSKEGNREFWNYPVGSPDVQIRFNRDKMAQWLKLSEKNNLKNLTPSDLMEWGLPGFFTIDLLLEDSAKSEIAFSKLSSGEQQMILNSNGLLYHLSNINSAHTVQDGSKKGIPRIAYSNVNIILDEVELYYHPEMQRNLVSDLMKTFEKVRNSGPVGIQGINVCILTHSPFILSDIPGQNVLNLTSEENMVSLSERTQTFGANIHEMLIGKFFMDSTTGEHVSTLIGQMLDLYAAISSAQYDDELLALKEKFDSDRKKFDFLVDNIGEDVIRSILRNHLDYMDEVFNPPTFEENEKD